MNDELMSQCSDRCAEALMRWADPKLETKLKAVGEAADADCNQLIEQMWPRQEERAMAAAYGWLRAVRHCDETMLEAAGRIAWCSLSRRPTGATETDMREWRNQTDAAWSTRVGKHVTMQDDEASNAHEVGK